MKIMVSACLLGENCKYNGQNNYSEKLATFLKDHTVIPVCPEVFGGLPIPRSSCEIVNNEVLSKDGKSFTNEYLKGANMALDIARKEKVDLMILQSRSPSCGVNQIYDGTFSGNKIKGHGIFANLAINEGYKVMDIEDL